MSLLDSLVKFVNFLANKDAEKNPDKVQEKASPPLQADRPVSRWAQEVVYRVTSAFEGGKFGEINFYNLTGNFDDQGMSIGFLQWCTGQGSDFPLFKKMLDNHHDVMKKAMGDLFDEFIHTLEYGKKDRLSWAISINEGNKIKKKWAAAFAALCATKEFQQIQMDVAGTVLDQARKLCETYGVYSVRALALMFDIKTQNGSINDATHKKILDRFAKNNAKDELSKLKIIAQTRAEASNPRWVQDVLKRKMTIVNGTGFVHGDNVDLTKLGLSDVPYYFPANS